MNILVGLIRNKLVALLLGPMGMGLIALFSSTIKFVGDSTNLGLSISAIRDISAAFDRGDKAMLVRHVSVFRHWCLLTSLAGLIVCVVLSPLLNRWTFSFGYHTLHFVFLAPVVAFTTFTSGELAILKATRRLKSVAISSVVTSLATLLISVPVYFLWGCSGIIPSLLLVAFSQMIAVLRYSMRAYPFKINFSHGILREGYGFVGLGVAFILAGMAGSGAEMGIRAYLNYTGNIDTVGLYNAAYVMVFTYAGMVFTAMETDYYPRLSSVSSLGKEFNDVVNSQIEVSLHIVSPMLVLFILSMPLLLPALYSGKFLPVLPMMQVAALSMYARSMYVPVEYIALARGDSMTYFFVELTNSLLLVFCVVLGFAMHGLLGAGIGMTVASFVELVFVCLCYRLRYGYVASSSLLIVVAMHVGIGLCMYFTTFITNKWLCIVCGVVLLAVDSWYTMSVLRKNTDIGARIKNKFKKLS